MNAIDKEAVDWVVRRDRGPWTEADQADLDLWLQGDRRRQGAFLRAEAGWAKLDRASVLAADSAAARALSPSLSRRGLLTFGGAAAAAAAAAAVAVVAGVTALQPQPSRYGTAVGEVRQVPLNDGSRIVINTESQVSVDLSGRKRSLRLESGEAWFEVAKDPDRPFTVASGPAEVTAVGTAFSVRRRDGGAEVLVTEGVVSVAPKGLFGGQATKIAAGQRVFIDARGRAGKPVYAVADIDRALAWRSGQIILDGDTLGEAVREFNRYNARKIVLADPSLADERLVGWFRTYEPESFAVAAAGMLGLQVVAQPNEILLQPATIRRNMST
ncbi:FecR family protein [Caulobacter sp. NIBR2454]|uniref:FecR family protein n=1 Tax=Caulobacter sp. NIBR2454 TaxID=3015996 RepID=UPI0022B6A48D|nr:FecR domain-containing protein [Caulobacter sp. NIBR2454]